LVHVFFTQHTSKSCVSRRHRRIVCRRFIHRLRRRHQRFRLLIVGRRRPAYSWRSRRQQAAAAIAAVVVIVVVTTAVATATGGEEEVPYGVPVVPVGQQGHDEEGEEHGKGAEVEQLVIRDALKGVAGHEILLEKYR
jgi:hypothetical protein